MKKPNVADIVRRQTPANVEEAPRVPSIEKPADDHRLVFSPAKKRFAFLSVSLKSFVVATITLLTSTGVVYATLTFTGSGISSDQALNLTGVSTSTLDYGSSTLQLHTTNNGPITTGKGTFTVGGSLVVSGIGNTSFGGVSSNGTSPTNTAGNVSFTAQSNVAGVKENDDVFHILPKIDKTQTWSALQTLNLGTTPQDAILLDIGALGSAGTRNSHNIHQVGHSFDTVSHTPEWRNFVNVRNNAGGSEWRLQSQLDGNGYSSRLVIFDDGTVAAGGNGFEVLGGALSANGHYLRGNGISYVDSTLLGSDLTNIVYNASGTAQAAPVHIVQDTVTLAAGATTVTLTGSAVFTSATSFTCTANDQTTANQAVKVTQTSGTSLTFVATSTDVVRFICVGN